MSLSGLDKMTEKSAPDEGHRQPTLKEIAESTGAHNVQPESEIQDPMAPEPKDRDATNSKKAPLEKSLSLVTAFL